jgi:hypothetical protein
MRGTLLALVAALGVFVASVLHLGLQRAPEGSERAALTTAWTFSGSGAVITAEPFAADTLVVVAADGFHFLAADGRVLARHKVAGVRTGTVGDLDGDGAGELVLSAGSRITVLEGRRGAGEAGPGAPLPGLQERWTARVPAAPTRLLAVDLDGDGRREVVAADPGGRVLAFSAEGRPLWQVQASSGSPAENEPRGLDDVKTGAKEKARGVAFGFRGGRFGLLGADGREAWTHSVSRVRRVRVADLNDDGEGEILVGDDDGTMSAFDQRGRALFSWGLGDAVGEIRALDTDGDPTTGEIVLGGKGGAVTLIRVAGPARTPASLWSAGLSEKISTVGGVDGDGDGRQEVFVGTERGILAAFRPDGLEIARVTLGGAVQVVRGLAPGEGAPLVVAAAGSGVAALRLDRSPAPGWYRAGTVLTLGLLLGGAALLGVRRLAPPAPVRDGPAVDEAALRARVLSRQMARLDALAASGRVSPAQLAERRAQLEAAARQDVRRPAALAPPPPPPRGR